MLTPLLACFAVTLTSYLLLLHVNIVLSSSSILFMMIDTLSPDEPRKGAQAPDPLQSDLGRTDDVPRETAQTDDAVPPRS